MTYIIYLGFHAMKQYIGCKHAISLQNICQQPQSKGKKSVEKSVSTGEREIANEWEKEIVRIGS